jgi:phospholipid transport system substrate-binding protein
MSVEKPIDVDAAPAADQRQRRALPAKRLLLSAVLLVCMLAPVSARAQSDPKSIVQGATQQMLRLIEQNLKSYQSDPPAFHKVVESTLARHFDFERMSKLVLGNDVWQKADAAMRNEFISQFRNLLVRTYGSVMLNYRGQPVSVPEILDRFDSRGEPVTDPNAPDKELRVVRVRTKIENSAASQGYYFVDYVFLRGPQAWGVVDVSIDGVSLVTTYSVTFKTIVQQRGMAGLNSDLRKLNEAAAVGTGQ